MNVLVHESLVSDAYNRFVERYFNGKYGMGAYFWAYVGLTNSPNYGHPDPKHWDIPADAARMIEMLSGPHSEVIFKMLDAQGRDPNKAIRL